MANSARMPAISSISRPATTAARWCRSARSRPSATSPGPTASRATTSIPAAEVQGNSLPGYSTGYALAAMEKLARERLPDGFGYEWTELAYQEKLVGNTGLLVFGGVGGVRVPGAGGAVRELGAAALGGADRADVPARGRLRPAAARLRRQHPRPDRLRRADRPCRQERDPDRRVRAPGRGAGPGSLRRPRCRRRARGCGRS